MHDPQGGTPNVLSRFLLDGRVAFLSGAAGHLGQSMARALAGAGAHVVLNGRREGALQSLAAELAGKGNQVSIACFDITDENAVRTHLDKIAQAHNRLDILVNNANSGRPGTIHSATAEDFHHAYRVNVVAAFQLLQLSLPLLRESGKRTAGGASVVNISSMYGSVSPDPSIYGTSGANSPPYYGSAKAALIQLTRYAACHLASDRIRVNCISPGPFPASEFLERDPGFGDRLSAKVPMGRVGSPHEVEGPLLFLASDAASYVTGANLAVDGGWTAW
ncbi:MAG: SDR family oxidoreductase [Candidatus Sulfotelmatobacter sp.]|jgi:NAD(P)-dependent dehydrogenase (short-subunit alcohol dehydrogenase family)